MQKSFKVSLNDKQLFKQETPVTKTNKINMNNLENRHRIPFFEKQKETKL